MLRSKFHRPWQPRVSGPQLYNPSAHSTESQVSFSDTIEEVKEEAAMPAEGHGAAAPSASHMAESVESMSPPPGVPETPEGQSKWYARLVERLVRH